MASPRWLSAWGLVVIGILAVDAGLFVWQLDASDWRSLPLLALLVSFAAVSELGSARVGEIYVSSSFLAIVLAMVLLGPVPAAVLGLSTLLVDRFAFRKPAWSIVSNAALYATVGLVGGIAMEALVGNEPRPDPPGAVAITVLAVALASGALNFILLAWLLRLHHGRPVRESFWITYAPTFPYMLVAATLAAAAAHVQTTVGLPMLAGVVTVLVVSEFLLRSVAASLARAAEVIALTKQRMELVEEALLGEQAERRWLAAHLHDETLQLLSVAEQDLEVADEDGDPGALGRAREEIATAVAELRRTLTHFHPASAAAVGCERALAALAGQLGRRSQTRYRVHVDGDLGREHDALLYTVGRELLGNASKHAGATEVELSIRCENDLITLTVRDDGDGFDTGAPAEPGHVGLSAALHRVEAAGGQLVIASALGRGTTVDVTIPAGVRPDPERLRV